MQKSKSATIIMLIVIIVYTVLTTIFFINTEMGNLYRYIINPIFWILLAIFMCVVVKTMYIKKVGKNIFGYVAVAVLSYIIVNLLAGLFVTFGRNTYSTTLYGFAVNLWIFGTVIISKELVRYKLVNNVYKKDEKLINILVILTFTIVELGFSVFYTETISLYYIFKLVFVTILPVLIRNILCTYMAKKGAVLPAILYVLFIKVFLWTSPILPKTSWIMSAFIDITIPAVLFLYIRYTINKTEIYNKENKEIIYVEPKKLAITFVLIILAIWFAVGIFPIKPLAVATGSMKPNIDIGDIVIIKKCDPYEIEIDDVIEYKLDNISIIHRVVAIETTGEEKQYITKGDNNDDQDMLQVKEEQIVGKVIAKVKYLGYPAIWFNKNSD